MRDADTTCSFANTRRGCPLLGRPVDIPQPLIVQTLVVQVDTDRHERCNGGQVSFTGSRIDANDMHLLLGLVPTIQTRVY